MINHPFLRKLRLLGQVEGVSTLILFGIAMPLKYLGDLPVAVRITGSVHGILFLGLAWMLVRAIGCVPISPRLALAGLFAAVVPFGPFVFDRWLADIDNRHNVP